MPFFNFKKPIDLFRFLTLATRLLLVAGLGMGVYVAYLFILVKPQHPQLTGIKGELTKGEEISVHIAPPAVKAFAEYEEVLRKRDIFNLPGSKPADGAAAPAAGPAAVPTVDLQSSYRLVGILLDHDPRAVVEDLKSQETLFLSRGQQLGEITVEDIQQGKVILTYNGQRYELTQ